MTDRFVLRWLMLATIAALEIPSIATTYYVRPDGHDQADGQLAQKAFKTVLRGAQALNHGDRLIIAPGTYRESILIAERFAADGSEMEVMGDESGELTGIPAGPVVIQAAQPDVPALSFHRLRHLRIRGLTFRDSGQGLSLEKSQGIVVERCTFDGLSRGAMVRQCDDVRVESCVVTRCTMGIVCLATARTRLAHLTVGGSLSAGIMILSSGTGTIRNSVFAENNSNIVADDISAPSWSSDYNVLTGTTGPWGGVPVIANVFEWSAASGQDRHSAHVAPKFKDPSRYDLHPRTDITWAGGLAGSQVGQPLEPKVALDRDARPLAVREGTVSAGAYDFTAAARGEGRWRRLPSNLHGEGPRQSAGVFLEDGSLVRTLLADAAGVGDVWWDGLDDLGRPAAPGKYRLKTVTHDVRLLDDGAVGDNGGAVGAYNCDNADRVVALPDGGFIISTAYDEGGYPLRRYSASGQSIFAANLSRKDLVAVALAGSDLYGVVGSATNAALFRMLLNGDRVHMLNGEEEYRVFDEKGKAGAVGGLAIVGGKAYVSSQGSGMIRVLDLATGKKGADWTLPGVSDVAADSSGALWAIAGTNVVALDDSGKVTRQYPTGMPTPRYLAMEKGRFVVIDRKSARLILVDAASGKIVRALGKSRALGEWTPVSADLFRDPRGAAFLQDGRLVLTEQARVRVLWPETATINMDLLSNFMDTPVVHPTQPEYLYCYLGIFHVDPKTGAWTWVTEEPRALITPPGKNAKPRVQTYGSPSTSVVLGGKPFLAYVTTEERLYLFDLSDPVKPRLALEPTPAQKVLRLLPYSIMTFSKDGDIVANGGDHTLSFVRVPFKGLDSQGNPTFDFAHPIKLGVPKELDPRGMACVNAPSCDPATGDIYYLAVTERFKKMVPGWGADGTGVGKSTPEGKPLWFSLSSGGNYQSGAAFNDGTNLWYFAGKSFGGQIDVFDTDGLRLTTGNWSWPCNYSIGFVDLRYGVHPYRRADGRLGAYVEDDLIGRFARCRLDGAETVKRSNVEFNWTGAEPAIAAAPESSHGDEGLKRQVAVPRVSPLKVDGDWSAWVRAGVEPQIVMLPIPGFVRHWPEGLLQDFRAGTAVGALAHDGKQLYAYFLVTDDTPHFDADNPGIMWAYDGVDLWLEEEQVGMGFVKTGKPALFKYRFHNRQGKEWTANYPLNDGNVWGAQVADVSSHPLGRRLATITGNSLVGRSGFAFMAAIPFDEIKLVGGVAGRKAGEILPVTGAPGEVVRIGASIGGIAAWGREQDYHVYWPAALIFSDPTRNVPCVLQ